MPDDVRLAIGGALVEHCISYEVDADLYQAADSFTLELPPTIWQVGPLPTLLAAGQQVRLFVNGALELTGLVDGIKRTSSKQGSTVTVTGRDLTGLIVDSYCEQFVTIEGKTIKQVAELVLKDIPFINRQQIIYQENIKGKLKGKKQTVSQPNAGYMDTAQAISHIEPGMTAHEVLSRFAASRGLLFFSLPDGTLVFGRPKGTQNGPPLYTLLRETRPGGAGNVLSCEEQIDLAKRWSRITVLTQQQGGQVNFSDAAQAAAYQEQVGSQKHTNGKATETDPTFPFRKPMVVQAASDSQSPRLHARMLLEKQRSDGYQLAYTVVGHSQDGLNWRVNELVRVEDEHLGISGVFLIYARRFKRSKSGGSTTQLRLGPPGLVAAL